jgi:hypothetical protein
MYWPEELPAVPGRPADLVHKDSGARKYHGNFELVASNYMEVLDVLSFAGKADVSHWLEEDDQISTKLYWRQTFCRETQELSVSTTFDLIFHVHPNNLFRRKSENIVFATDISTPKSLCTSVTILHAASGSIKTA